MRSLQVDLWTRLPLAAALAMGLTTACGEESNPAPTPETPHSSTDEPSVTPVPPTPEPTWRPSTISLLERLDDANLEGDFSHAQGALIAEDNASTIPNTWADSAALRAGETGVSRGCRAVLDKTDFRRVLSVAPTIPAIHRDIPTDGASALRVTVRWKPDRGGRPTQRPSLALGVRPSGNALVAPDRAQEVLSSSDSAWTTTVVQYAPPPGETHLRTTIEPGNGISVDWVRIEALTPLQGMVGGEPTLEDLRRPVTLGPVSRESLLLPVGMTWTFRVAIPASNPRLESELGFLGGPGACTVRLSLDGAELATTDGSLTDSTTPSSFQSWRRDLSEFAGREVDLEVEVTGDPRVVAAWGAPEILGTPEGDPPPSIILISIDTLRADSLTCYGGLDGVSPAIDRLAEEGTLFEDALSPSSYTLPAHATLFTGQDPLAHRTFVGASMLDARRSFLLADALRDQGYRTAGFTAGGFVGPKFGFAQGFDQYDTDDPCGGTSRFGGEPADRASWYPSEELQQPRVQRILNWIEGSSDQPFFLFLHTYFAHNYVVEPEYLERFGFDGTDRTKAELEATWERATAGDAEAMERMRERYLASIAQLDHRLIAPLLDHLDRLGLDERTIVVLTSDHGEQFGEHGRIGHGRALWSELLHVPLLIRGPGFERGSRRSEQVGLVDVTPTLAVCARLPPDARWTGKPITDGVTQQTVLHFQSLHGAAAWEGLVSPTEKLIRRRRGETGDLLLFDRVADPGDLVDLAKTQPERTQERLTALEAALARSHELGTVTSPQEGIIDEALRRNLEALGYQLPDDQVRSPAERNRPPPRR